MEPKDNDGVEHSETWGQLNRQFVEPYAEFIYANSCPQHYQIGPKTTNILVGVPVQMIPLHFHSARLWYAPWREASDPITTHCGWRPDLPDGKGHSVLTLACTGTPEWDEAFSILSGHTTKDLIAPMDGEHLGLAVQKLTYDLSIQYLFFYWQNLRCNGPRSPFKVHPTLPSYDSSYWVTPDRQAGNRLV